MMEEFVDKGEECTLVSCTFSNDVIILDFSISQGLIVQFAGSLMNVKVIGETSKVGPRHQAPNTVPPSFKTTD